MAILKILVRVNLFFLTGVLFANHMAAQHKTDLKVLKTGLYKLEKSNGNVIGFFKFQDNGRFSYFGISEQSITSKPTDNLVSFQEGFWKVDSNKMLTIKSEKKKYDSIAGIADSIKYTSYNLGSEDSIRFEVLVLDQDNEAVIGALIYLKEFENKLHTLDSKGKWQSIYAIKKTDMVLEIIPPPGYYKIKVPIQTEFNNHYIIIYLKKIPEPFGIITNQIRLLNIFTKWEADGGVIVLNKYCVLKKANLQEAKQFIGKVEQINPYYKDYFINVRKRMSF